MISPPAAFCLVRDFVLRSQHDVQATPGAGGLRACPPFLQTASAPSATSFAIAHSRRACTFVADHARGLVMEPLAKPSELGFSLVRQTTGARLWSVQRGGSVADHASYSTGETQEIPPKADLFGFDASASMWLGAVVRCAKHIDVFPCIQGVCGG